MYISKIRIENFRNFSDFEIELKPFSLIIGENNIGKTNLLEALGLIFSQELNMMKKRTLEIDDINYKARQAFKAQFSNEKIELKDIKFPEVKVEVTMTGFNEDQEAVVGDWFTNKELTEAKLTYLFRLREGWKKKEEWLTEQRKLASKGKSVDFPIKEYEYYIFGGGEPANKVDFYFLKMLKMELLDALRDAKRELTASGEYRLLYKILSNRDESKFADIKDVLNSLDEKLQGHAELEEIKKNVKEYLDKIPLYEKEGGNSVSFRFSSPELAEILKKFGMVYGIDPVGVERNGLGRNNLLYISLILSHLTGASLGSNYTFFRLVGIEEPEAHLYPHLQSHLAKNIKGEARDDLRVILTSHSPYIASKLDLENTHILYREGDDIKAHDVLKGIKAGEDTERYLKKFLDATNSTMFFARKIILVEGIAEELLIPKFFELHTGKTLEKVGCSLINVRGLAFKHFLEIIRNGYFVKCVVFTDSDVGTKTENRAADLQSEYEKEGSIIKIKISSKGTFEKDLIDANKNGDGKKILLDTIQKTKPTNGKALAKETATKDIETEKFFTEIEHYKSEFAYDLLSELQNNNTNFKIPDYMKEGFNHVCPNEKEERAEN